ncbi:putative phosphoglycerate mutase family domain protein [Diplodia seriata]|uniref:Putative phosphoglycerate mutase family domain protein n=1 Tax=Diplodia seriata TaxID=420778 RepID=A0A0G2GFW2_9PEZI|nr:putative phosphoglycerate mutase family domain protein [Diplodia seriata]
MIILIRHAQSEGNKNRDIHQFIPDHRVKLTPDGWQQAEDAGSRLRSLLRPDDTLQFFTSPYRRTRETTEGILRTLTSDDPTPSPFPRHTIKVFEEPRLREQDFGNFQPCSAEMERMWQERADYGHFFYRIPNGESAADAYHWSVEYFEDLRNINHCEFIVMKQNSDNGKFILENELRTCKSLPLTLYYVFILGVISAGHGQVQALPQKGSQMKAITFLRPF